MAPYACRAMARTPLIERLPGIPADVIEAQLARDKSGPLGMACDRAQYLNQRRAMMKAWADQPRSAATCGQVIAQDSASHQGVSLRFTATQSPGMRGEAQLVVS